MKQSVCLGIAIGILILIILISINYSYKNKESFVSSMNKDGTPYNELIKTINTNKTYLDSMKKDLQKSYLRYPKDVEDISQYIDAEKIIASSDKNKLKQIFNINFLQHLQNEEICKLEADLESLKGRVPKKENKLTKGLKSIDSGAILKVGYIDKRDYDFIANPKFSLVMDENKQSCLQYLPEKNKNENEEIETVKEVGCDYDLNTNNQKFSYRKIEGNTAFNNALHPDYNNYKIADYYKLNNYPFYIVHPFVKNNEGINTVETKECLTLNDDGLSIEPCNLKSSQRFLLSDL